MLSNDSALFIMPLICRDVERKEEVPSVYSHAYFWLGVKVPWRIQRSGGLVVKYYFIFSVFEGHPRSFMHYLPLASIHHPIRQWRRNV